MLHLLSNSVNKRAPGSSRSHEPISVATDSQAILADVGGFIDEDLPRFFSDEVKDASKPLAARRSALRVYTWVRSETPIVQACSKTDETRPQIAKGLIVRSDERGYAMVDQLLDLFHDSKLGRAAATSLSVIAEDKDRVLSKESFAVIRVKPFIRSIECQSLTEPSVRQLLYKQRFFTYLLPKLVTSYKAASTEDQVIYLTALSSVLQHIPKQLTLSELPKVRPLVLTRGAGSRAHICPIRAAPSPPHHGSRPPRSAPPLQRHRCTRCSCQGSPGRDGELDQRDRGQGPQGLDWRGGAGSNTGAGAVGGGESPISVITQRLGRS